MIKFKEFIKENPWAGYALVFAAGALIGAVFYPTKRIEERERSRYEEQLTSLKEEHKKEMSQLEEYYEKDLATRKEITKELHEKVKQLEIKVTELKSSKKTSYYKIVRPDGTIETKKFTETEVSESTKVITEIQREFTSKLKEVEEKWETIHRERVVKIKKEFDSREESYHKRIAELEKSKVTEINKKSFGAEVGIMTNKNYYGHVTGDVFGPVFVGVQGEVGPAPAMGIGLGLRF